MSSMVIITRISEFNFALGTGTGVGTFSHTHTRHGWVVLHQMLVTGSALIEEVVFSGSSKHFVVLLTEIRLFGYMTD